MDLWYAVQKRLSQSKKSCKNGKTHILVNKVFCEDCHKVFCKCGKNDNNGMAYLCCKDKVTKWSNCNNKKYIKELELQEYLKDKINILLKRFYDKKKQIGFNDNLVEKHLFKNQINSLNKEKEKISKELQNKNLYFQDLYEDLKKGLLDEKQYLSLRTKYKEDLKKLEERLQVIEKSLSEIRVKQNKLKNKVTLLRKYEQIEELNVEIVNDFVDQIVIGKYDDKTNHRKIHIVWNFVE